MSSNHSQRAYQHIRRELLNGSVAPGSRLSYGSIRKEIGVSATPVREAVGQLASEGFVELVPQLGAVVRELNREEATELYELREALEACAAGQAAERISTRQKAEIRDNLSECLALIKEVRNSGREQANCRLAQKFRNLDLAFHMILIEATRNRRMLKVVGDSHILTRIFQADRHEFSLTILEATVAEHEAIAKAIEAGDREGTHDAMRSHIRNSLNLTLNESDVDIDDRWWTE
tara:strand:- start:4808 stop:5509 length:702 start_codon:yes stop_codon:yes gene_type:complete